MAADSERVSCPSCNKGFRFRENLAGKPAKCPGCGSIFRMPEAAGQDAVLLKPGQSSEQTEDDLFPRTGGKSQPKAAPSRPAPPPPPSPPGGSGELELDVDEDHAAAGPSAGPGASQPVAGAGAACPSCGGTVNPGAVICLNCGYNLKAGVRMDTQVATGEDEVRTSPIAQALMNRTDDASVGHSEYRLPLIFIGAAFVLTLINALVLHDPQWYSSQLVGPPSKMEVALRTIIENVITIIIQFPFLVVGIFLTAKIFASDYGLLVPAIVKLLAMGLFIQTLDQFMNYCLMLMAGGPIPMSGILTYSIIFGVFIGLAIKFFDMDVMEAFVLYLFLVLMPLMLVPVLMIFVLPFL